MEKKKRQQIKWVRNMLVMTAPFALLPGKWTEPVVRAVILPAHAQTSRCDANSLAGKWTFVIERDMVFDITLTNDGFGSANSEISIEWTLRGNQIEIFFRVPKFPAGGYLIRAVVSDSCTRMHGGSSLINSDKPMMPDTFSATKRA